MPSRDETERYRDDVARFKADVPPPAPPGEVEPRGERDSEVRRAAEAKSKLIIDELLGCNLKTEFTFNYDKAVQVWGAALLTYDLDLLKATVDEWGRTPGEGKFPSLGEFEAAVRAVRSRGDRPRRAPGECAECGGVEWVDVTDDSDAPDHLQDKGGHSTRTVRPCSSCRPKKFELWAAGHYEPGHYCDEGCPGYVKAGRKRGRAA